ncbi:MAG: hypothetical protein A3K65_06685 [Euryarchaeota archaeon RBG_16_68_12]|nr:MAG: hypothetical protein A3K65_06685 [Euryarchaeota archaeon RBG_16_68_12]
MADKTVYLDSSATVKRYLVEGGSEAVDALYHRAEAGDLQLAFSQWNLGEVLGAFAKAQRRGMITAREMETASWTFIRETLKLRGLRALRLFPVRGDLLARAIPLLFRHGLGQADALQIASSKELAATALITADQSLLRAARAEGLSALDPTIDRRGIETL